MKVFSKEKYIKHYFGPVSVDDKWPDDYDGAEYIPFTSIDHAGIVVCNGGGGMHYCIDEWCEEVPDAIN